MMQKKTLCMALDMRARLTLSLITVITLLSMFFFSATVVQAQSLRYANFPPASTFPSMQMDAWIKAIEQRTAGQVQVQTFPGGTLLDVKAMLRGVARGQADIGCISMLYYPGSFPLFELFGLPLGFTSAAEASYVAWEVFKAHTPKEFARYKVLSIFASAPSQVMSTKAVTNLQDVQNITLRASGPISDALEALGGHAVSIPMSETPEALQKGVVDGVCSSWDTLYDMNYAERCSHGLAVNMPVYPFAVIMNKKSWEKLPEKVRQQIDAYADAHVQYTGNLVDAAGAKALDWAVKEHNFQLTTIDDEAKAHILKATAPLIEAWKQRAAEKGLDAEAILADVQKFRIQFQGQNR